MDEHRPAPAAPVEIELKLFVPEASAGRLWSHPVVEEHAIGPLRVARLESRYFDTPDRAFAGRTTGLRLRRCGRAWSQTVKTTVGEGAGALSHRGEWETAVSGPAFEWPKLRALGAPLPPTRTFARRLAVLFTTSVRRETRMIRLADGSEAELAYDVGTIIAGRGAAKRMLPIREIELEIKRPGSAAPEAATMRFAARLVRDLPLIPLAASKASRGFALVDGREPDAVRPTLPEPQGDEPAARFLARVLSACNAALLANAHVLLGHAGADVEAGTEPVHQARVAIRRMRSALRMFAPVAKGRREVDHALRSLGHDFGIVRDLDVFATETIERIGEKAVDDAEGRHALTAFAAEATRRRADAHRALVERLATGPFGATSIAVERFAARLRAREGEATLADCAASWLAEQRDDVVGRARRIAVLDPPSRHRLRIAVKRLRYALDLLGGLYDRDRVTRFHDALADLQDKLGTLNDETMAKAAILAFEATPARDVVFGRHATWLERHLGKQLPKVGALSVAFELAAPPWSTAAPRTLG